MVTALLREFYSFAYVTVGDQFAKLQWLPGDGGAVGNSASDSLMGEWLFIALVGLLTLSLLLQGIEYLVFRLKW